MAALLTVGFALVEAVYGGTRRSMIESGAGDLQVYHSGSTEPPQMMVGPGGPPELLPLPDYASTETLLRGVEGVGEVVPLETGVATVFRGNYLDDKLAAVRAVVREPASLEREARLRRLAEDLARTLQRVAGDARRREEAFASDEESREDQRALEEATSERFWERFSTEPLPVLEFLENRVAKQVGEGETLFVDYLGSELPRFARAFPRFELVQGQMPPPGSRGILLGHALYEQSFKLPMASRLDEVRRERERGNTLAADERLRTQVERNVAEIPDLLARLDVERATALRAELARQLGHEGELDALLTEFLKLDDGNFDARYRLFHDALAPHLPLYRIRPGDTLVVKGLLGIGGGVPVKVWGTFRFRGLGGDTSRVNSTSLMDLVTVRHLSGRQTRAEAEEARRLIDSFGLAGGTGSLSTDAFAPPAIVDGEVKTTGSEAPVFERAEGLSPSFTEEELLSGGIPQAALVLKPGATPEEVAERIRQLVSDKGLPLTTADWQQVGGFISGVVAMTQVLLLVIALLLGLFVLLVSTGTLLLLARERVGEVGTLRAVGMQRRQVFLGLLLEGLFLGGAGSVLGIGLGAALLKGLMGQGLAVHDDTLQFFLGGPVLYPQLEAWHVLAVGLGVLGVVMGAALVPAWRGSAVTPLAAMRQGEG
ncbi:FtsX-like permease family protein [Archangium violaceum]|uniref:ABC transporter permease n=1 Tax=Archangium violaceum TaxID=83451 RepID=UPI001EF7168D|nr:FtsX-like permease family protein [Archangium violaceum]